MKRIVCLLLAFPFACLFSGATPSATTKKPPLRPVNINTATSAQLQLVPGIGPATAEKILTMRKSYGPFKSVDDLLAIKGLGKKRLDKMRKYLTVGKAPSTSQPEVGAAKQKPPPSKPVSTTKAGGAEAQPPDEEESGQPPA
jgi:competence protein ComEA